MKPFVVGYHHLSVRYCISSDHRTYAEFLSSFLDLLDLGVREAFDLQQSSGCTRDQALHKI